MTPTNNERITIVSGLPRSGTSMMMRMLEAGGIAPLVDAVRGADADNPNGYYEFEPVLKLERDSSWVPQAAGKSVKIVYRLLYHLPAAFHYDVIFMKRELREVIASQEVMLQRKGKISGGISEEKLAELFTKELNQFYKWIGEQSNFRMLPVNYKEVIDEPARTASEVCRFLDKELDQAAMARVCEPSLYRQRR